MPWHTYQATGYQTRGSSQRRVSNYLLAPVLVDTIKRGAEAEATPNNCADSNPTTRLLRFVRPYCSYQLAERGYYPLNAYASRSNVRLAGVKVTTSMSAWVAISPPYRRTTRYVPRVR